MKKYFVLFTFLFSCAMTFTLISCGHGDDDDEYSKFNDNYEYNNNSYSDDDNSYSNDDGEYNTSSEKCHYCKGQGDCRWTGASSDKYYCHGSGLCWNCNGKGYEYDGSPCYHCNKPGEISIRGAEYNTYGDGKCAKCGGSGVCSWCNGTGLYHN